MLQTAQYKIKEINVSRFREIARREGHHEMFIFGQSTKLEVITIFSYKADDGITPILTLTP